MVSAADGGARNTNLFQCGTPRSLMAISTFTREKSEEPSGGSSAAKGSMPAGSVRVISTSPPASSVHDRAGAFAGGRVVSDVGGGTHAVVGGGARVGEAPSDDRVSEPPTHADSRTAIASSAPVRSRIY